MGISDQLGLTNHSEITPREVHEILRNDRRRQVIEQLSERVQPIELGELAERIAAAETGETPPPRNARQSVYNSLHQTHLPKLDGKNVIEYDSDRKTIALREPAREVDLYMEIVTPYGITWAGYYRSLGVLALLTVIAVKTGVPLLARVPTLAVASVFLAVIAASTSYQLWSRRWFYLRSLFGD